MSQATGPDPQANAESLYRELGKRRVKWTKFKYFRRGRRALEYSLQRSLPYRKWVLIAPSAACLLFLIGGELLVGEKLYQSYPVSKAHSRFSEDSHATFNNHCGKCHMESRRTLERLDLRSGNMSAVSDRGCVVCHELLPRSRSRQMEGMLSGRKPLQGMPAMVHHSGLVIGDVPACAECHPEHRAKASLKFVASGYCVDCHGNLRRNDGKPPLISSQVTNFVGGHPDFHYPEDKGRLRFNHYVHTGRGTDGTRRGGVNIACGQCHEPDPSIGNRYMKPVRFDLHCRQCHALRLPILGDWHDDELLTAAASFWNEPVAHGLKPIQMRQAIADRYGEFIEEHPRALEVPYFAPLAEIPGKARTTPETVSQSSWTTFQAETAQRFLFDLSGGCRSCHISGGLPRPGSLPEFLPTNIRARWLPQSVFSHHSHVMLDCSSCHHTARKSESASDVLMPSIALCQQCHKQPASPGRHDGNDCRICHRYHDVMGEQVPVQFSGDQP